MSGIVLIFAEMMLTLTLGLAPIVSAVALRSDQGFLAQLGLDDDQLCHLPHRHRSHVFDRCQHGKLAASPTADTSRHEKCVV